MSPDALLTVKAYAVLVGVRRSSVYRAIRQGRLEVDYQDPNQVRIWVPGHVLDQYAVAKQGDSGVS